MRHSTTTRGSRRRKAASGQKTKLVAAAVVLLGSLATGYVSVSLGGSQPRSATPNDGKAIAAGRTEQQADQQGAAELSIRPYALSDGALDVPQYWTADARATSIRPGNSAAEATPMATELESHTPVVMFAASDWSQPQSPASDATHRSVGEQPRLQARQARGTSPAAVLASGPSHRRWEMGGAVVKPVQSQPAPPALLPRHDPADARRPEPALSQPRSLSQAGNRPPQRIANAQDPGLAGSPAQPAGDQPYYPAGPIGLDDEFVGDVVVEKTASPVMSTGCGGWCPPSWYGSVELMALSREGPPNRTLSNGFFIAGFDFESGGRATAGRRVDCVNALEVSIMGLFDWRRWAAQTSAREGLYALFTPRRGLTAADIEAFNGAAYHRQEYESELTSIEVNRKWFGWDVFSSLAGFRYINVQDNMLFLSVDSDGDLGLFTIDTDNYLLGGQIGAELMYPIGRLTLSSKGKLGALLNINDTNTTLVNGASVPIVGGVDDTSFACLAEFGVFASYRITRGVSARAGYELSYIYGVALAADQPIYTLTPVTGYYSNKDGDVFYHGGSAGVEITY